MSATGDVTAAKRSETKRLLDAGLYVLVECTGVDPARPLPERGEVAVVMSGVKPVGHVRLLEPAADEYVRGTDECWRKARRMWARVLDEESVGSQRTEATCHVVGLEHERFFALRGQQHQKALALAKDAVHGAA